MSQSNNQLNVSLGYSPIIRSAGLSVMGRLGAAVEDELAVALLALALAAPAPAPGGGRLGVSAMARGEV